MADDDSSVLKASFIMVILSVLLFWLPVVGPLLAGFVGGRKAGSPGAAFVAAILPALVAGGLLWLIVAALPDVAAWVGALFGLALAFVIAIQMGLVILGAIAGGLFPGSHERRAIATVR